MMLYHDSFLEIAQRSGGIEVLLSFPGLSADP